MCMRCVYMYIYRRFVTQSICAFNVWQIGWCKRNRYETNIYFQLKLKLYAFANIHMRTLSCISTLESNLSVGRSFVFPFSLSFRPTRPLAHSLSPSLAPSLILSIILTTIPSFSAEYGLMDIYIRTMYIFECRIYCLFY